LNFPAAVGDLEHFHVDVELLASGLRDSYPSHTKSEEEPENYPNADGKPDGPTPWNACINKQETKDYSSFICCGLMIQNPPPIPQCNAIPKVRIVTMNSAPTMAVPTHRHRFRGIPVFTPGKDSFSYCECCVGPLRPVARVHD
jgi:hypothetical protein